MTFSRDLNDEYIRFLNDRGFHPIIVPTGGIMPPTVYLLEKASARYMLYRSLNAMLASTVTPLSAELQPSSVLEKATASKRHAEVSVSFFQKIAKLFGMDGGPKLDAMARAADNLNLKFADVKSRLIEPGAIEEALKGVKPEKFGRSDLDSGIVHIAYEYLYSNKIEARVGDKLEGEFKVQATISEVASLKVGAGAVGGSGEAVVYDGKQPVAFAFRVGQLSYEELSGSGGRYRLRWVRNQGEGLSASDAAVERYVVQTGQVFEITETPAQAD